MKQKITVTIVLNKKEKDRLGRIALRYGLSLSEFSKKILSEIQESIPMESFEDYEHPKALRTSLSRALRDVQSGRLHKSL